MIWVLIEAIGVKEGENRSLGPFTRVLHGLFMCIYIFRV